MIRYVLYLIFQQSKNQISPMEEHRLKPMTSGYNEVLFKDLYQRVEPLKKKLASEINCHRFGVSYDDICSWFDVKIIFVFQKHCEEFTEQKLLAYIINSMRTYKKRLLITMYQKKYSANVVDFTDVTQFKYLQEEEEGNKDQLLKICIHEIKTKLGEEACLVFETELYPPPYIVDKMRDKKKNPNSRIPTYLIADYLGLEDSSESINRIQRLRNEVQKTIKLVSKELANYKSS